METARGQQLGEVVCVRPAREGESKGLKRVQRQASGRDLAQRQEWHQKEKKVLVTAREITAQLGLPIKVVVAEYTFDGQRLTLLYVSEEKKANIESTITR